MPLRTYSGNAKRTALTGDITAASTTLTVSDGTGYPAPAAGEGPFVLAIDLGLSTEEKMLVSSRTVNTLTISQRGFDGTAAVAHSVGAFVDHVLSATDIREANAFANGGGVTTAGGSTITASGAAVKPLVVKGASGQTANLTEFQNSAGTVLTGITADGSLSVENVSILTAAGATSTGVASAIFALATAANHRGLVVRGRASQTANLAEFQNSAGTVLASIDANGVGTLNGVNSPSRGGFIAGQYAGNAANATLYVRGASGQTANLAEFQNSAGTALASVSATGQVVASDSGITRGLVFGLPDSAGTGFRTVRVAN